MLTYHINKHIYRGSECQNMDYKNTIGGQDELEPPIMETWPYNFAEHFVYND
jgi:hypothetical protein